jgi:Flp pilus assembly protein TadG
MRRARQSGQALVELALALPILLILALGVIELGRYSYISILVGNAAHAGAVYGSQTTAASADTAGIKNAAYYDFAGTVPGAVDVGTTHKNGFYVADLTVTSTVACGCDALGTISNFACDSTPSCATGHWVAVVTVTATGTFNSLFNYPGIPTSLTINRTSSMRVL